MVFVSRYLKMIASTASPIAIPMRMLEIYSTADTYQAVVNKKSNYVPRIVLRLVQNGNFFIIMFVEENDQQEEQKICYF